jgi:hypothetical protein
VDELHQGLATLYEMLDDEQPMLRLGGLDPLDAAERDRRKLRAVASALLGDPDAKMARRASEVAR